MLWCNVTNLTGIQLGLESTFVFEGNITICKQVKENRLTSLIKIRHSEDSSAEKQVVWKEVFVYLILYIYILFLLSSLA